MTQDKPWTLKPSVSAESSLSLQLLSFCGRSSIHAASTAQVKDLEPVTLQCIPSFTLGSLLQRLISSKSGVIELPIENIWRSKPQNPHEELKSTRAHHCCITQSTEEVLRVHPLTLDVGLFEGSHGNLCSVGEKEQYEDKSMALVAVKSPRYELEKYKS